MAMNTEEDQGPPVSAISENSYSSQWPGLCRIPAAFATENATASPRGCPADFTGRCPTGIHVHRHQLPELLPPQPSYWMLPHILLLSTLKYLYNFIYHSYLLPRKMWLSPSNPTIYLCPQSHFLQHPPEPGSITIFCLGSLAFFSPYFLFT